MVSAIVLGAGLSRRMGSERNKLLLPWQGKALIAHVVAHVLATTVEEVIVVLGYEAELVRDAVGTGHDLSDMVGTGHDLSLRFIFNPNFETGMTSSIQQGVKSAKEGNAFLICLGDMPFIRGEEYQLLLEQFEKKSIADPKCILLPFYEEKKANPILFSAFYKDVILAHTHPEGCRAIVQEYAKHIQVVKMPSATVLQDVDDWEAYLQIVNIK